MTGNATSSNAKWDAIYRDKTHAGDTCWLLQHCSHLLPNNQTSRYKSLDLACGLGANALFLAQRGFESHAWDNSETALLKLKQFATDQKLAVHSKLIDVETTAPAEAIFDVIVVSQFLNRDICPAISKALKPGGLLFYQTFHKHKVNSKGPSNPKFLLDKNELLSLFSDLDILFYREDGQQGNHEQGLRDLAYFVGQKPV